MFATGGAQVTVTGATFHLCQASMDGGGLWFDSCVATLSDALFDGTQATRNGGGCAVAAGGQVLATTTVWVDTQSGAEREQERRHEHAGAASGLAAAHGSHTKRPRARVTPAGETTRTNTTPGATRSPVSPVPDHAKRAAPAPAAS